MEQKNEPINPIGDIVNLPENAGPADPKVAKVTSQALLNLGFCDDTMALLVKKTFFIAKGEDYKDIRKNFPAGKGDED